MLFCGGVTYPPGQSCVACHGLGHVMVPQPAQRCSQCEGKGSVLLEHPVFGFICEGCWERAGWQHGGPEVWAPL